MSFTSWLLSLTNLFKNGIILELRIDFLSILVQRIGGAASHLALRDMDLSFIFGGVYENISCQTKISHRW